MLWGATPVQLLYVTSSDVFTNLEHPHSPVRKPASGKWRQQSRAALWEFARVHEPALDPWPQGCDTRPRCVLPGPPAGCPGSCHPPLLLKPARHRPLPPLPFERSELRRVVREVVVALLEPWLCP